MGKGNYILRVNGKAYPVYGSHKGGETNLKTRDVPASNRPNTMLTEPTGGAEFAPLEIMLIERVSEGLLLGDVLEEFQKWAADNANSLATGKRAVSLTHYADAKFTKVTDSVNLVNCFPKITFPDGERGADNAREVTITIYHQGSEFKKG